LGLLDMGLNSTINRELARLSVLSGKEQEMRHLVRTLEVLYWGVAIFVGIIVFSLSPFIARYWINAGQLSPETIEEALLIMGIVMTLQMPIGFYSGGLMGLQRQVLLNVINVCMSTMRSAGAVLILWLVSPTIQAFFLWQIVVSAIHVFFLAMSLWRKLPPAEEKAVFQKLLLKGIWRFAAGMTGISTFVLILTQLDKIILSKLLSLEMFGYYMLASLVAASLVLLIVPVFNGVYPRFAQLVSLNDEDGLKRLYHKSCQLMSVLILPVAMVIAFFSYEILLVWTRNPLMAERDPTGCNSTCSASIFYDDSLWHDRRRHRMVCLKPEHGLHRNTNHAPANIASRKMAMVSARCRLAACDSHCNSRNGTSIYEWTNVSIYNGALYNFHFAINAWNNSADYTRNANMAI
jgi:O-antigen/teichoic acid export membrane protein